MQIKKTHDTHTYGTSFHGEVITTTANYLLSLFPMDNPDRGSSEDKVQFNWSLELADGTPFTIYDWKEYRPFDYDEPIEFHIGGHRSLDTIKARKALQEILN